MNRIDVFISRLRKIGIEVKLFGNYPWIYIDEINGIKVTEKFEGNHGFTLAFISRSNFGPTTFTDITEIFKLLRKYRYMSMACE